MRDPPQVFSAGIFIRCLLVRWGGGSAAHRDGIDRWRRRSNACRTKLSLVSAVERSVLDRGAGSGRMSEVVGHAREYETDHRSTSEPPIARAGDGRGERWAAPSVTRLVCARDASGAALVNSER